MPTGPSPRGPSRRVPSSPAISVVTKDPWSGHRQSRSTVQVPHPMKGSVSPLPAPLKAAVRTPAAAVGQATAGDGEEDRPPEGVPEAPLQAAIAPASAARARPGPRRRREEEAPNAAIDHST